MDSGLTQKKKPNPRENANPLSAATFSYTIPTFVKGFKKELDVSDLHETLSEHKSSLLGNRLETQWRKEEEKAARKNKQPSLRSALIRTFGLEFLVYGIIVAINEICVKIAQPLFLGQLISYFMPSEKPMDKLDAYLYATGVIGCSLLSVFFTHPLMMGVLHVGMKMRISCCSLIYRKALRLSKTALGQTTAGQVVNLLSNDVNRFDIAVIFAHQLWVGPFVTAIVTYLMYREVGISAVFGVLFILLFVPLQFVLGRTAAVLRLRTALRTDERVRLMNEIISGIQVIKMYTWEKPFTNLVSLARRYEIKSIRLTSYVRGVIMSFVIFTTRVSLFITVLAYLLYDQVINAQQVFVLTAFYNILRQSMAIHFPQGIAQIAEANVSITRLNKFLLYDETQLVKELKQKETVNGKGDANEPELGNKEDAITIQNATAKWTESSSDNTFTNLHLKVKRGGLIAVIGPVGSGKTSLLHAILKELPLITGSLNINGEISYASQEPWLFTGSVRQNILFGQEMDRLHYKTVVRRCALERDFKLLPYDDKTIVGERGVSLSGGQRARINLARAVYKEADIYILDDPLSAVDTHVGKQLFEECIQGFLRRKTVILVTHQLQYLKDVDHIIILENGLIKAEGSFGELQKSGLDFAKLLNDAAEDEKKPESVSRQVSLRRISSVTSTTSVEETVVDTPQVVEEQKSSGSISSYIYRAYLGAGGNCCVIFIVSMLFLLTQLAGSAGDYFITFWVNLEQERATDELIDHLQLIADVNPNPSGFAITRPMNYSTELRNLNQNREDSTSFWDLSRETCIYIYSGITIATIVITLVRSFSFFTVCMRASVRLHDRMFSSLTHATMRFFNTNTSGRILNRFSKDMGAIDEVLPGAMIDTVQIGLGLLGVVVVVGIVSPWLMIPTFIVGVIFYFIRVIYLKTSRNVKRVEGVTRSPVFAHLNASLQGLTTIRAFNAQPILEKEFDNHQDLHSSAYFSFISTSRAFGFWLDLICVVYIACVTLSFLVLGNEQYGGNVGLAITQSIGLTGMFQWGMRQSAELENQMTSVERVLEYTSLENEPPFESSPDKKPPKTWPDRGEVKFVKVFLKYFPQDPPVLRNLNFTIAPLEKVGIVGRTGAGKSSLISALFQLTETEGSIIIDDIDTKGIGLHDLRSKISIIPQEPVLFSGTMRKNLDPFDEYNDEVLWKALEEVELKDAVSDLVSGLNSKMSEGGTNFSVGQRQLVCLARAIIRNNKILVLDEATANVDPQTDALIQHTIRRKFANCTVLTIAHRLHTVMDSDKVLVMDAGTMVEFDHPHILLQNQKGILYGMVQQTGKAMAEVLIKIAEDSYKKLDTKENLI